MRVIGAVVVWASSAGWASGESVGSTAEIDEHRYYFDQQVPLVLDRSRVAVRVADGAAADGGAEIEQTLAGWRLIPVREAERADISGVIERLGVDAEFVSPVFIGEDGGPVVVTPDVLLRFRAEVSAAERARVLGTIAGVETVEADWADMSGSYRVRVRGRDGAAVLREANRLARLPGVVFAEPDWVFTGHGGMIPNDPGFPQCWGLHNTAQFGGIAGMDMSGPDAWDLTIGDPSIIVVVLDVGVQQDHPDLNLAPGQDFTTEAPGASGGPVNDCDKHGTSVAGCVSAIINNEIGTVGIAPGCRVASARAFISSASCSGRWTSQASATVAALAWAESIGARVTNNSNGYGFTSAAIESKYRDTRAAGIVHFASAGNSGGGTAVEYPARLASVNAVAALDMWGSLAWFSTSGPGLDFSAPGQDIYTTDRTGAVGYLATDYGFLWGTSFASPYAAGVAALVLSVHPGLSAAEVELAMKRSALDRGDPGYDERYGWGFVNARRAIAAGCLADVNTDGVADFGDYLEYLNLFDASDARADCNDDGLVDFVDYLEFLNRFEQGCG